MTNQVGSGFAGEIEGLSLVDLVQFACLAGDDRKLSVLFEKNHGKLYFSDSEIIHAEFGELTGEQAFYTIMSWPSGTFSMLFARTKQRTIDSSWNFLLLEAARRLDEQGDNEEEDDKNCSEELNVLVVDDSRLFTKAFIKLFEDKLDNAKVIGTANNGTEALKFLEMQVPDLVTLDINMPVMGGDVALKHIMIRSPAPVVLVSNFSDQICFKLMDFMRFGAVDVVAKPVNPQSWDIVSRRLFYILENVKEFQLHNVSRAKTLRQVTEKRKPEKAAKRLHLILGGLGGMLELQKIIPVLEYQDETVVIVLQNMYPTIAPHFASYFNGYSEYTSIPLGLGTELLGGQCRVGNIYGKREISKEKGKPILSGFDDKKNEIQLDADRLLQTAAGFFGAELSVVMLSGVDHDLKKGLDSVVAKGGRVIFQNPDSCLFAASGNRLNLDIQGAFTLKTEKIASFLAS